MTFNFSGYADILAIPWQRIDLRRCIMPIGREQPDPAELEARYQTVRAKLPLRFAAFFQGLRKDCEDDPLRWLEHLRELETSFEDAADPRVVEREQARQERFAAKHARRQPAEARPPMTHCRRGHNLAVVGFYRTLSGGKRCRECRRSAISGTPDLKVAEVSELR